MFFQKGIYTMKVAVLENLFGHLTFEETLQKISALGVEYIEVGAGGYPGKAHCDPAALLADEKKYEEFIALIEKYNMKVSALACHGNPVHPDKAEAKECHDDFVNAILLAEKMGVDTIVAFSGCPGDCEESKYPNWVTCSWPTAYSIVVEWQWKEKLIPYWCEMAKFALEHHVPRIAFEMHPGFCVYNPATLLKLRAAVTEACGEEIGNVIGANLDPSHLIWQGIDPVMAVRDLGRAIYHVHAKDTKIDKYNTARNGVLDVRHYSDEINRSWVFRTVGYGNGESYWRDFVSALNLYGYDRVLSIEHEDSIMTKEEGLEKAVRFLQTVVINDKKPGKITWA